jgi:hypothetical protein
MPLFFRHFYETATTWICTYQPPIPVAGTGST